MLTKIQCEDGSITRDQRKILQEQCKFYQKLYTANPKVYFAITNDTNVKLMEEQSLNLDRDFTYEEFKKALQKMPSGKTPGLTVEFYKVFFGKLGHILWDAVLFCYNSEARELYRSARREIISLIPKKDKNPLLIKNYRPITLLNVDYKIITKMITNRFTEVLSILIGTQQSGYVPGRFIGVNIRKLIDIMLYLEREEIPGILLTIDFEKCFDTMEHSALISTLKYFNIGENMIRWVQLVYKNFELSVMNGGHCSKWWKPTRGIHQGCALSGPSFLFVAEVLGHRINQNRQIVGVNIEGQEEKISQYADDTNILSAFDANSLRAIVTEFNIFHENTGLKVNYDKSIIYRLGSIKNTQLRLPVEQPFQWSNEDISVLGVIITMDQTQMNSKNYDGVLEKAQAILKAWNNRQLSLTGKRTVVNALVTSLFVYKMQVLPQIEENIMKVYKKMIENFIWNARRPKI